MHMFLFFSATLKAKGGALNIPWRAVLSRPPPWLIQPTLLGIVRYSYAQKAPSTFRVPSGFPQDFVLVLHLLGTQVPRSSVHPRSPPTHITTYIEY